MLFGVNLAMLNQCPFIAERVLHCTTPPEIGLQVKVWVRGYFEYASFEFLAHLVFRNILLAYKLIA